MSLKFETPITDVPLFHQGKVRDMYDLGDSFLMVASDRLSAFDVVLPTPIPGKGKILNQLCPRELFCNQITSYIIVKGDLVLSTWSFI